MEGVGKADDTGGATFFGSSAEVAAMALTGDSFLSSIVATDGSLPLKLLEDKFFRIPVGGGIIFPAFVGEGGIASGSSMLP